MNMSKLEKTILAIEKILKKKKINTHIVSRGYLGKLRGPIKVDLKKHSSNDVGDEALLLAKQTDTWVSKNKFEEMSFIKIFSTLV